MARASAERTLVAWAKANTPIDAIVAGRVATKLPADPTFPFLRLRLAGGAPDLGEAPLDQVLVQFDCYGTDDASADLLERTLVDELDKLNGATATNGHGFLYGARTISARRTPEPDTGWARFTVDSTITIRNP